MSIDFSTAGLESARIRHMIWLACRALSASPEAYDGVVLDGQGWVGRDSEWSVERWQESKSK